ncbi:hypothetical protein T06_1429 [Trichinella sp. T6]|nr:hypothetical protein T06_1429 [Trichinella sp. T6]
MLSVTPESISLVSVRQTERETDFLYCCNTSHLFIRRASEQQPMKFYCEKVGGVRGEIGSTRDYYLSSNYYAILYVSAIHLLLQHHLQYLLGNGMLRISGVAKTVSRDLE